MTKDLLSIADLNPEETVGLVERASHMKREARAPVLSGMSLALLFEKPSLRTKVSFDVAMHQLGGHSVYLSPEEVGLGRRESVADVARVLSRYADGIAARTFSHQTVQILADNSPVPVINALSDREHPCQVLSDLLTIYEKKEHLRGLTLAFIGDGNNMANSLLLAASLVGMDFRFASPPGYMIDDTIVKQGNGFASCSGSRIELGNDPRQAVSDVDIIYTDVWISMGQEADAEKRRHAFAGFQVDSSMLDMAKGDVMFMHPLPAHNGEEVAAGLLNDPRSVVFDQAENRLHLQKALLVKLLSEGSGEWRGPS
jgi:ornithine carbamoyltransferase